MDMIDLLGKEVVDTNGSAIGILKNVIFDEKMWQVLSFEVQLDVEVAKEFQLKKLFQNPIILLESTYVQQVDEKITLKTGKDELMTALAPPSAS
jgi:sporulation protein YlmC with PRC-barrel domain